jgi:hypothetical protein
MQNFFTWLLSFVKTTPPPMPVNFGVISSEPTGSDWIRGQESGIRENVVNVASDWRGFYPPEESQLLKANTPQYGTQTYLETDACMSFAGPQTIEAQLNFAIQYGTVSAEGIAWLKANGYINAAGKVEISKRFTAKMSGTTINGNTYQAVWASMRNDGLVPESEWPMPAAEMAALVISGKQFTHDDVWNLYYAEIPQALKDKALEFKKHFTIAYEWVKYPGYGSNASLVPAMQLAPLHIATAVCPGWNTDAVIQACGPGGAHATMLTFVDKLVYWVFDHYVPFVKKFAKSYDITSAFRGVITEVLSPTVPATFKHTFTSPYELGDTNTELILLQNFLKLGGYFPLTVMSSGYYGNVTAVAVLKYQLKRQVDTPANLQALGGKRIGNLTLAAINKDING